MKELFLLLPIVLQNRQTMIQLRDCNEVTARYGLILSEPGMQMLIENRKEALGNFGRVEFGGGIIQKLIYEFMDSPYLYQDNYTDTLLDLQECFYYFKNESLELITDDDLIRIMRKYFDEVCHGSVEYLQTMMLENHCRDIRYETTGNKDTEDFEFSDEYEEDDIDYLD